MPSPPTINGKLFDVNEMIPEDTLFETCLKYCIYASAVFQILCLAALFLFPEPKKDLETEPQLSWNHEPQRNSSQQKESERTEASSSQVGYLSLSFLGET